MVNDQLILSFFNSPTDKLSYAEIKQKMQGLTFGPSTLTSMVSRGLLQKQKGTSIYMLAAQPVNTEITNLVDSVLQIEGLLKHLESSYTYWNQVAQTKNIPTEYYQQWYTDARSHLDLELLAVQKQLAQQDKCAFLEI